MSTVTPLVDMRQVAGGFMSKLLRKFSKPFNPDPKPIGALAFVPGGATPRYPYMSVQNATLYFHSQPLETPVYTPEVSYDLTQYTFNALAQVLTSAGYGFTVTGSVQDGTNASMLLGFVDFSLNNTDTIVLQVATSKLWKYLYPIALSAQQADLLTTDAVENEINVTLARGFWLDFWGDWLGVPRVPGMSDLQYAAYLFFNSKVPRVNNMAIEDILEQRYQVPVQVKDSGQYQFTVYISATLMNNVPDDLDTIIQEVKGVGIQYILTFLNTFTDDYVSYLYNRYGWTDLSKMATFSLSTNWQLSEKRYGYQGTSFQLGGASGGNSQLNVSALGGGLLLKESYTISIA